MTIPARTCLRLLTNGSRWFISLPCPWKVRGWDSFIEFVVNVHMGTLRPPSILLRGPSATLCQVQIGPSMDRYLYKPGSFRICHSITYCKVSQSIAIFPYGNLPKLPNVFLLNVLRSPFPIDRRDFKAYLPETVLRRTIVGVRLGRGRTKVSISV
jgi:hypothetical protein